MVPAAARRLAAAAALVLAIVPAVRAQDAAPPAVPAGDPEEAPAPAPPRRGTLEELVVTATRSEEPLHRLPASAARVDAEEIRAERLRRTLPDALLDTPSVMVQRTAHGQASPFLRGFTGYHTLLLVDGVRLNNSTFRSGPNQYFSTVDAWSVDSLEVVRGPASVLHGSDAVGGVLNAIPRRRRDLGPGSRWELRSMARFATAEDSLAGRVEFEGNRDGLGVAGGVTGRSFGDLRAGQETGLQPETGYREEGADLRLDIPGGAAERWTLGLQRFRQRAVPRTEQTIHGVPYRGTVRGSELERDLDQARDLAYARWASTDPGLPALDRLEATLSFQRQREVQHRARTGARTDEQGVDVRTVGLQVQGERETVLGRWTGGVEWWRDSVRSFRRDEVAGVPQPEQVQGPVGDDAGYDLAGIYLQDAIPAGAATITAGARFTRAAAEADRVDDPTVAGTGLLVPGNRISLDDSWTSVVGSLRAVAPASESVTLFGGLSQAFRAPNLSDLTRLDDTSGVETPSPDLDPERFLTAEAGARLRGEAVEVQAALWRTWTDGIIVPSPTGNLIGGTPEVRKDNVGDGWVHGFELEGTLRPAAAWTVAAGFTWMDGEVDQLLPSGVEVREDFSRLMPTTAVATVAFAPPEAGWRAWVSARVADRQDRLSLKDATDARRIPPDGTPGYAVYSAGFGCEVRRNARVSVVLENLLDRNYRIHGSGVNEPGLNLGVYLELTL
jgi:hemoglobin/transferrin/lactoferrin receptor protein